MPVPDKLIQSGLLYEGSDYETWERRIKALLEHKLDLEYGEVDDLNDIVEACLSSSQEQEVISWFRAYASKHVLQRVPDHAKKNPDRFLRSLKSLAKPFRFMELPDHVQVAVGRILLPRYVAFYHSDQQTASPEFPPILHAGQQLRKKFLPIFYKETAFGMRSSISMDSSNRERRQIAANTAQTFRAWAYQTFPQPQLRRLRKVEVDLLGWCVAFELSEKKEGFGSANQSEITYTARRRLTAESEKLLKEHVLATDRYRKECGMQGEGLVLLITSRPELWVRRA